MARQGELTTSTNRRTRAASSSTPCLVNLALGRVPPLGSMHPPSTICIIWSPRPAAAPPTPLAASRATACAPTPMRSRSWSRAPSPSCRTSPPTPSRRTPGTGGRPLESSTRLRRPARQRRVDFLHEVLQREVRLDEVRRRAQRRRLLDVPILAEVRQHDDRDARRGGVLLERLQDVEPLELGHDDVEKNEIRTLRARDPQRLLAVDRREHLEPVLAQPRHGRAAQEAVVLREEDPSGSLSHAGRPARARPAPLAPEGTDWTSRNTRKPPGW